MDMDSRISAMVEYWRSRVHLYPALDAPERGEQGVLDYAEAVDRMIHYAQLQASFRERMAELNAPRYFDMDDNIA